MKNVLLFLFVAVLFGVAVLSCSDGKLNLLLLSYGDQEDPPEYIPGPGEPPPSSSSFAPLVVISSSSAAIAIVVSSSSVEPAYSSSIFNPPRSSSSNRGVRSSASTKVNRDGEEFEDYPILVPGDPGVFAAERGGVTRYWDACKPSCSYPQNLGQKGTSPHGLAKTCDRNGNEMPLFFRMSPVQPTWAEFLVGPNACNMDMVDQWLQSPEYSAWKTEHPNFPSGNQSGGYICSADQIPYAVNDTLAYAFAANAIGNCGKCYMLQFRGDDWAYAAVRQTHKALAGKTLIVMVNNFGVSETAFDIMIPGGGLGNYNAYSEQLGLPEALLGHRTGGLLAECTFEDFGGMPERRSVEEHQECVRQKCNRTFANHPVHLKGCLWLADWFMGADNPEAYSKEIDCPKYLIDRYSSTMPFPKRPADLNPGVACNVGGVWQCDP